MIKTPDLRTADSSCPVFRDSFSSLPDPHRENKGNYTYPLDEILFLSIAALISGMDNWMAISNFGKIKLDWLRLYFPFELGIPSHDVLGKLFARIDPEKFNACFIRWVDTLSVITKGEVIAVDGKSIRKSNDTNRCRQAFHVVSAYAASHRICLGQQCVAEKSNEITAIPKLLELLLIKDAIVTIDAMGCQKDIAEKIIEKEADYILMVKDNQKKLKQDIVAGFERNSEVDVDRQHDLGHGRAEIRTCEVSADISWIKKRGEWKGLKSIIKITSERIDKQTGKDSTEIRYYISSLPAQAAHLNEAVRKHWRIENNLHWALDVIFKEDQSLKKKGYAALNFNIMTKIALSLIEKDTGKKSKVVKRQSAALDDKYRAKLLLI